MRAHYSGTIQKFLLARVLTFNPLTFVFARSLTHTLYDLEAAQFRVYLYNPTHWAKERGSEEMQQLINQAQHDWQLSWIGETRGNALRRPVERQGQVARKVERHRVWWRQQLVGWQRVVRA